MQCGRPLAPGDQDNGALTLLDALVEVLIGSTNKH